MIDVDFSEEFRGYLVNIKVNNDKRNLKVFCKNYEVLTAFENIYPEVHQIISLGSQNVKTQSTEILRIDSISDFEKFINILPKNLLPKEVEIKFNIEKLAKDKKTGLEIACLKVRTNSRIISNIVNKIKNKMFKNTNNNFSPN